MALPNYQQYVLFYWIMLGATLGCIIGMLAVNWTEYDGGVISLWQECRERENVTTCDGKPINDCRSTIKDGAAWLVICRTMACLSAVFLLFIYYSAYEWSGIQSPMTFVGQMMTRLPLTLYFIIGTLMLSMANVYLSNYEDYYSKSGKRQNIRPQSTAYLIAYLGGGITLLNSIFLCSRYDSGFKAYLIYRFKVLKSKFKINRDAQSDGGDRTQQMMGVKSRFPWKKKGNGDTNPNNGNGQVTNKDESTQTQSDLPGMEVGQNEDLQTVVQCRGQSQNEPGELDQNEALSARNAYVVGNNSGLDGDTATRCGSILSVSHLNVDFGSLSGENNSQSSSSSGNANEQQNVISGQDMTNDQSVMEQQSATEGQNITVTVMEVENTAQGLINTDNQNVAKQQNTADRQRATGTLPGSTHVSNVEEQDITSHSELDVCANEAPPSYEEAMHYASNC